MRREVLSLAVLLTIACSAGSAGPSSAAVLPVVVGNPPGGAVMYALPQPFYMNNGSAAMVMWHDAPNNRVYFTSASESRYIQLPSPVQTWATSNVAGVGRIPPWSELVCRLQNGNIAVLAPALGGVVRGTTYNDALTAITIEPSIDLAVAGNNTAKWCEYQLATGGFLILGGALQTTAGPFNGVPFAAPPGAPAVGEPAGLDPGVASVTVQTQNVGATVTESVDVPALSTWSMMLAAGLLVMVGWAMIRRRSRAIV